MLVQAWERRWGQLSPLSAHSAAETSFLGEKGPAPGSLATVLSWSHLACGSLLCAQRMFPWAQDLPAEGRWGLSLSSLPVLCELVPMLPSRMLGALLDMKLLLGLGSPQGRPLSFTGPSAP